MKMKIVFGKGSDSTEKDVDNLNRIENIADSENTRKFLEEFDLIRFFGNGPNASYERGQFTHFFTSC